MKHENDAHRDLIHRLLDGEIGPDEKSEVLDKLRSDPALGEEFEGLAGAVRALETSERTPAPPFFTAEVMRRLPRRKPAPGNRLRDFMLRSRVLKWNMATALAATALFVLILNQAVRTGNEPVGTAMTWEQVVTVTLRLNAPEAHHVEVAGTFSKWSVNALSRREDGVWTISIPLKPGEYSYMFIVDGKAWVTDPNAETYRDDGFGNKNAVVRVKT